MKKKIITLTPAEMTTLLLIYKALIPDGGFWKNLNEKIEYISQSYPSDEFPDGIPSDTEEIFKISIPMGEVQNFILIIQSTLENKELDGQWEEITEFSARMETLIALAEEVEITRAMCILLGGVKLSDPLVKKLTDQKVEILSIKTVEGDPKDEAQKIVDAALAHDEDVQAFVVIIVADDVTSNFIQEVFETFDDFAADEVYVYQLAPDGFTVGSGDQPSVVDIRINDESQIEWESDIKITLSPD